MKLVTKADDAVDSRTEDDRSNILKSLEFLMEKVKNSDAEDLGLIWLYAERRGRYQSSQSENYESEVSGLSARNPAIQNVQLDLRKRDVLDGYKMVERVEINTE